MPKTVIVIPCYNEEKRLPQEEFKAYFESRPEVHFLFANDGSRDGTLEMLQQLTKNYPQAHVFDGGKNQGKANITHAAFRYALTHLEFDYIGFFDADLATPLEEIDRFMQVVEQKEGLLMVCGSRVQRLGSNIRRKPLRHYMGRTFATAVSRILCLPVYDTQCGAKILRKDVAETVTQERFMSPWFFDVEIFARIILAYGYEACMDKCFEYPLDTWIEKGDTRLKTKDFLRTPLELLKLRRKYHREICRKIKEENK